MDIKAVSFNIRFCDDPDGNTIAERAPRLKKILMPLDADVIGLQESSERWEPFLNSDYGDKYEIFLVHRSSKDSEATPIMWKKERFNCIDKGFFWLSDTPDVESRGWDERFNCYRICLWCVLEEKKTGERFFFMNTHYGFGDKGQSDSSDLIASRRNALTTLPTVITGDFNMTPDMAGYKVMTRHFDDVNALTAKNMGTTYHGYDPVKINDQHIDYCFISKEVTPLSYSHIEDMVDGKYPTDHFGLLIELTL